jgi:hypothetical protein
LYKLDKDGPLYNCELGHWQERWRFWKSRFSKVKDEVIDEDAAKMAQQAVGAMESIEKVMRKRDLDRCRYRRDSSCLRVTKDCCLQQRIKDRREWREGQKWVA